LQFIVTTKLYKPIDKETNYDYFEARYYNSKLGRSLSAFGGE